MPLSKWFNRLLARHTHKAAPKPARRPLTRWKDVALKLESLEDRITPSSTTASAQLQQAYGQLPISFVANVGQTDPQVNFLAHGSGYSLFLTPTQAVLGLSKPTAPTSPTAAAATDPVSVALSMQLVGANPDAQAAGQDLQASVSNYIIGNDPSQWHTNVANYGSVEYQNVYQGVNLVYYGNQQQLEYDFDVAPGADPGLIQLNFKGAEGVSLDAQGNLVVQTAGGDVVEHAPVLYQEVAGARQAVSGGYVLEANGQVGVAVGSYDSSLPLVIDPVLSYSTYLGGSGTEIGLAIAVDSSGNAYITGVTTSTNFPTASPLQGSNAGAQDAFVTKLTASGTLAYSTYLGGSGSDGGYGIAVDSSGNAYVTGYTSSTNFPTASPLQGSNAGGDNDAFVTKLTASGTLAYSTYLGGSGSDVGYGIAVDSSGNAYVTGVTTSTNFPTASPLQGSNAGGQDAFVTKLTASGALAYSTYLGGTGDDYGYGIAVDSSGNAYVTGGATSTNFPTASPLQGSYAGGAADAFVTKLTAGGTLAYSTYLGGSDADVGYGIAVESSGNAYVTGETDSTNFPTENPLQGSNAGGYDAFVTKLTASGTLAYSTYLGGSGSEVGRGIAVDSSGNAYVTGVTSSTNFPTASPLQGSNAGGVYDAFVTKLAASGTLAYSTYLGGSGDEQGYGIAVDSSGNAYVTGYTTSTNFPTASPLQGSYAGAQDAFVTKLNLAIHFVVETSTTTATAGNGFALLVIAEDANNNPVTNYTNTHVVLSIANSAGFFSPSSTITVTNGYGFVSPTLTTATTVNPPVIITATATDSGITGNSPAITVVPAPINHFTVSVPGMAVSGVPFSIIVTALDPYGNIVTGFTGTVTLNSTDSKATLGANTVPTTFNFIAGDNGIHTLSNVALFSGGVQTFGVTYPTTDNEIVTGTSGNIVIISLAVSHFTPTPTGFVATFSTPVNTAALTEYGSGAVTLGSPNGVSQFTKNGVTTVTITLPSPTFFTVGQAVHVTNVDNRHYNGTFTILTAVPGANTFTYRDDAVAGLPPSGNGTINLAQDVTLVGAANGQIPGTLLFDPTHTILTFEATANALIQNETGFQPVLPDDTYTATFLSGSSSNIFKDNTGTPLDGHSNGGTSNYTTTFPTSYVANSTPVLSIPDFAAGPNGSLTVVPPNDGTTGIPIAIYNYASVTDVTFTLSYNPALLNVTGANTGDSTDQAGSNFQMVGSPTIIDSTHATANFHFFDSTPQNSNSGVGPVVLGDIVATVPNSAAGTSPNPLYKSKELLQLSNITINTLNSGTTGVVSQPGVHVDAYFAGVTGTNSITSADAAAIAVVASGQNSGFSAFPLVDPAIMADLLSEGAVTGDANGVIQSYLTSPGSVPSMPVPPGFAVFAVGAGADPTLSLPADLQATGGIVTVPVQLDQPAPQGSTGMTQAILALTYDPSVLSVATSDITLGSVPLANVGWQLKSVVDAATGQIGIDLYSLTAVTNTASGSLVNITFQVLPGASASKTAVALVGDVRPQGQFFGTQVDDAQGAFLLTPTPTNGAGALRATVAVGGTNAAAAPIAAATVREPVVEAEAVGASVNSIEEVASPNVEDIAATPVLATAPLFEPDLSALWDVATAQARTPLPFAALVADLSRVPQPLPLEPKFTMQPNQPLFSPPGTVDRLLGAGAADASWLLADVVEAPEDPTNTGAYEFRGDL